MTQPATIDDRLRLALQSMFDAFAASSLYMMPWDYQVQKVNGGSGSPVTLDLQSTDPRMPNLSACPVWPGSDGSVAEPGVGATVMVVFSGGNPAKYRVVAMDPNTPPRKCICHNWSGVARCDGDARDDGTSIIRRAPHAHWQLNTGGPDRVRGQCGRRPQHRLRHR